MLEWYEWRFGTYIDLAIICVFQSGIQIIISIAIHCMILIINRIADLQISFLLIRT